MPMIDDAMMPFLLARGFRALVHDVHLTLADEGFPGLRTHHGFALQAIGDGCTSAQLGERLGVSKQAATKTAHALIEMELVTRVSHDRDRRERRLTLTERGRQVLHRSGEAFRDGVGQWRAQAGDDVVDGMLVLLNSVQDVERDTHLPGWPG